MESAGLRGLSASPPRVGAVGCTFRVTAVHFPACPCLAAAGGSDTGPPPTPDRKALVGRVAQRKNGFWVRRGRGRLWQLQPVPQPGHRQPASRRRRHGSAGADGLASGGQGRWSLLATLPEWVCRAGLAAECQERAQQWRRSFANSFPSAVRKETCTGDDGGWAALGRRGVTRGPRQASAPLLLRAQRGYRGSRGDALSRPCVSWEGCDGAVRWEGDELG